MTPSFLGKCLRPSCRVLRTLSFGLLMILAFNILGLFHEIGFVYHTTFADEKASLNNPRINQLYTLEW